MFLNYIIKNMDENILNEIISWKYDGKYSEYNMDSYNDLKARNSRIVNSKNWDNYNCYFKENELIGYTNVVEKENGEIFLGIGLAPKFCGKGLGYGILKNTMSIIKEKYPGSKIVLSVRSWNERAIKCYEKIGFEFIDKCVKKL